jgi:hypothetical protein
MHPVAKTMTATRIAAKAEPRELHLTSDQAAGQEVTRRMTLHEHIVPVAFAATTRSTRPQARALYPKGAKAPRSSEKFRWFEPALGRGGEVNGTGQRTTAECPRPEWNSFSTVALQSPRRTCTSRGARQTVRLRNATILPDVASALTRFINVATVRRGVRGPRVSFSRRPCSLGQEIP